MNTVTFADLLGTIRRRIAAIAVIGILCAGLALAQGLLTEQGYIARSYTAEATIYLYAGTFEKDSTPNYSLSDQRVVDSGRRIVVSDSIAGAVRREFQSQDPSLTISSPFVYDRETAERSFNNFIYVDATSSNPQVAVDAANRVAEKAVKKIEETLPSLAKVEIYEKAVLRTSDPKYAAEPGNEALYDPANIDAGVATGSLRDRISVRTIALALFVGLFGSAFCLCAYEILRRKIRTAHDAEAMFGIPVIAQLQSLEQADENTKRELDVVISDAQVALAKEGRKALGVVSLIDRQLSGVLSKALAERGDDQGLKAELIQTDSDHKVSIADLQKSIEEKGTKSDLLLLDGGALTTDACAVTTAAAADVLLVVTQVHRATNKEIRKAILQMQVADTPLLGIVLLTDKKKSVKDR